MGLFDRGVRAGAEALRFSEKALEGFKLIRFNTGALRSLSPELRGLFRADVNSGAIALREDFVKAFTAKGGLQGEYLTELQKLGFFKDKGFVTMTEKGALELDNKGYAFFMRDNLNNLDKGVRDALIKDNLVKEVDGTFKVNYEAFSNDELSVMFKDQLEGGVTGQNSLPSEVKDVIRNRGVSLLPK